MIPTTVSGQHDLDRVEANYQSLPEGNMLKFVVLSLVAEVRRLWRACVKQDHEIQQILGRALGYPKYSDDQINFPGATGDEVCVGDHVAETLAVEAARIVQDALSRKAEIDTLEWAEQIATSHLRSTGKLASSPMQSEAAWQIRAAIRQKLYNIPGYPLATQVKNDKQAHARGFSVAGGHE